MLDRRDRHYHRRLDHPYSLTLIEGIEVGRHNGENVESRTREFRSREGVTRQDIEVDQTSVNKVLCTQRVQLAIKTAAVS